MFLIKLNYGKPQVIMSCSESYADPCTSSYKYKNYERSFKKDFVTKTAIGPVTRGSQTVRVVLDKSCMTDYDDEKVC